MSTKQSNELTAFYQAIQKWIDEGCSWENKFFSPRFGLCANLLNYCDQMGIESVWHVLREELFMQFTDARLDESFPFDESYEAFRLSLSKYTNPKRLAWIKQHAAI